MIKSLKTAHLFEQLAMMFYGHSTELKTSVLAMTHLNASEKEIEQLELKAEKWDDKQTQEDLELAAAVKVAFEKGYFARTRTGNVIAIDEQELLAWYKHEKSSNNE